MIKSEISPYDELSDTIHKFITAYCNWSCISSHFKMLIWFVFDIKTNDSVRGKGYYTILKVTMTIHSGYSIGIENYSLDVRMTAFIIIER